MFVYSMMRLLEGITIRDEAVHRDRTDDAGQSLPAHSYIWRVTVDQTSESKRELVKPASWIGSH